MKPRIKSGATDVWLLLMASYLHDIGMSISSEALMNQWKSEEFQSYLINTSKSTDKDLNQAANYILNIHKEPTDYKEST